MRLLRDVVAFPGIRCSRFDAGCLLATASQRAAELAVRRRRTVDGSCLALLWRVTERAAPALPPNVDGCLQNQLKSVGPNESH